MLSIIELIVSLIGIIGYFNDNIICMIIGLVGIVICDFIDIFVTGHNPFTIVLVLVMAVGATVANHSPLYNFTLFLCGENIVTLILGIGLILIGFIKHSLDKNDEQTSKDIENEYYNENEEINSIMTNPDRIKQILSGNEYVDEHLFINKENPYTGKIINNYDDIIEYISMYHLDNNGVDPLLYHKKENNLD